MAKKKDLKKFRGGIRLESTSEPTDLAGDSTDAGIMYYDDTDNKVLVHNGDDFAEVGGSAGGGLDTFYIEDFKTTPLDSSTNSDIEKHFLRETTGSGTHINFEKQNDIGFNCLRIALGETIDEYVKSPPYTPKERQQGQTCSISFYYKTNAAYVDNDMKLEVRSGTGNTAAGIETLLVSENILKNEKIKKFVTTFTVPSDSTRLQYRFVNTVTNGGSKYVYIDDVEMSQDPFVQADLGTITEWETFTPVGSYTNNVTYTGRKRRVGDTMEYQVRMTFTGSTTDTGDIEIGTSAGNFLGDGLIDTNKLVTVEQFHMPFGSFIFESTAEDPVVALHGDVVHSAANAVKLRVFQASGSVGTYVNGDTVKHNIPEVPSGSNSTEIHINFKVPIVGLGSTNTHIVTPAKSNLTDWKSYSLSTKLNSNQGVYSNGTLGQYRRVGDSIEVKFGVQMDNDGNSSVFTVALPDGLTFDTDKLPNLHQDGGGYLGSCTWYNAGTGTSDMQVGYYSSTTIKVFGDHREIVSGHGAGVGDESTNALNSDRLANNDYISGTFTAPIAEWGAEDHNFLAALPMTKWQKKQISGGNKTSDGFITEMQFSNLDKNKSYKLTAHAFLGASGNSTGLNVTPYNGGTDAGDKLQTALLIYESPSSDAQNELVSMTVIFSPKSDGDGTLKFKAELGSVSDFVGGSGRTFATLEELSMHEETDIW